MLQDIKELDEGLKNLINRELSSYNFLDLYVVQNLDLINYTAEIKGLNNNNKFVSVPLSSSLLGHGKGLLIPPEVNDVVLVGFLNGRKSSPVILGCIFNNFMNSSDTVLDIRSGEMFLGPKLNGSYFFIDENGNIKLQTVDGSIFLNGLKLPSGTGELNQILVADGDGNLVWSSGSAGGLYSFEDPFYLDGLHVYLDYTDKFMLDGSSLDLDYSHIDHNSLYNYASERHFLTTEIDRLDTSLATGFVRVQNGTGLLSSDTTVYEPALPVTPENPETKFLNGNREWAVIAIGSGGFAGNLYFTTIASDVSGYYKISYDVEVAETEIPRTVNNAEGDKLFATYLYDYAIDTDTIDAGVWVANYRVKVSNALLVTNLKMEAFVRHADTSETILWSDYSPELNNTDFATIRSETNQPAFNVATTDRLGVRIYGSTTSPTNVTITTVVGNGDGSYFTTPLRIRHDQLRARDAENSHPCEAISIDKIGTPTWDNQCDFNKLFGSTGRATGGDITDAGSSTYDVASGTGFIKENDVDTDTLYSFDWTGITGHSITSDTIEYPGVEYNSGSPQIIIKNSNTWDYDTEFPLGVVINETINGSDYLYVINNPWWVTDGMTNIIQSLRSFGLLRRDEVDGGLLLSVTGTRSIAVSAGRVWSGLNDIPFTGIDTSVTGTFEAYWYSSTGGWQKSDLSEYSVTQWNDITQAALQTIDNNKYCNVWVYGELNNNVPGVAIIYPQAQYNTPAEAQLTSSPSNLPTHLANYGKLLGRIIIKQGVDAPVAVQTVFINTFSSSVVTDHGNLSGLSDDDHTQYVLSTGARSMAQLTVDNLYLNANTISSTSGAINLTPFAGSAVVIDSHFSFDGTTMTAITDANTIFTAYTGKNITIEGVTFDGGVIAGATNVNWDDAYSKRVDTWGDGLSYSSQIASIDYNTTNLKITTNQIDTIQSIATAATPTFANIISSNMATANNHLVRLDQMNSAIAGLNWQQSILDQLNLVTSEPSSPTIGDRYINTATGDSSETTQAVTATYIYEWNGSDWTEYSPVEGWTVWDVDADTNYTFNGTAWVEFGSTVSHNNTTGLQGGGSNEYYHMTSAEHGNISNWDTAYGWGDHAGLYDIIGTASSEVSTHESTYDHTLIATALQSENDPIYSANTYAVDMDQNVATDSLVSFVKLTVGSGSSTISGDILINFNMDRSWSFKQLGDDASSYLSLVPETDAKNFVITNSNGNNAFVFSPKTSTYNNFLIYDKNATNYISLYHNTTDAYLSCIGNLIVNPTTELNMNSKNINDVGTITAEMVENMTLVPAQFDIGSGAKWYKIGEITSLGGRVVLRAHGGNGFGSETVNGTTYAEFTVGNADNEFGGYYYKIGETDSSVSFYWLDEGVNTLGCYVLLPSYYRGSIEIVEGFGFTPNANMTTNVSDPSGTILTEKMQINSPVVVTSSSGINYNDNFRISYNSSDGSLDFDYIGV